MNLYLIVKTLHVFLVVAWFSGLFYLPRIFVNLAQLTPEEGSVRERLLLMAVKLKRFMIPLQIGVWVLGLWMAFGFGGAMKGGWLHAKIALVLVLSGYDGFCARLLRQFRDGKNTHSHVWYRVFNEIPALLLLIILFLVIVKPF